MIEPKVSIEPEDIQNFHKPTEFTIQQPVAESVCLISQQH